MPLNFTNTNEATASAGVKLLVYGRAGIGKTTLCATAPKPLIISAESGLLSLRNHNIPVIEIKTVDDLIDAHRWLQQSPDSANFETVCIDSITEIGEVVLSNAKRLSKDPRQAYGELIEKMTMTIKEFRDLRGKHVYMSAKVEPVKDEMTGITRYMPAMPGSKLGPQLPYLFDEVLVMNLGRTQEGVEYRYLQTAPDMQYDAKDRSGALAPQEKPDLTHIITTILGKESANGTA